MGAFDHLEWTYDVASYADVLTAWEATYDGAFEQLFGLGRGEFEQKFSTNSNVRGLHGGMFKLRLTGALLIILHDVSPFPNTYKCNLAELLNNLGVNSLLSIIL